MTLLNPIFIAPPFGQFFSRLDVSPVQGSYTLCERKGRYKQAIKTIRPLGKGNWVNRIGLRNPGIANIPKPSHCSQVLSVTAIEPEDWEAIALVLSQKEYFKNYAALELNVSCPNASIAPLLDTDLSIIQRLSVGIIIKLPPLTSSILQIERFLDQGVQTFHLFNTYPTTRGGLSGQLLRRINIRLLKRIKKHFGNNINIIAGGGIHNIANAQDYLKLGISALSLGTICYYPWQLFPTISALKKELPDPISIK